MTTIEPRVAERRRGVSEDRARHRLRWILGFILFITVVAFGLWLIRSPFLSISTITIVGADISDPAAAVEGLGVSVGMATIEVDGGEISRAVEKEPWVASADVSVQWPGTVVISVKEHVPVAPAPSGEQWMMLSAESTVLELIARPVDGVFIVDIDVSTAAIGDAVNDPMVSGALEFGSALRPDLGRDAVMYVEGSGLAASVDGHTVRLGRPVDLAEKAVVLAALIDSGLAPAAEINLIAPTRPAVTNSQPEVEDEQ